MGIAGAEEAEPPELEGASAVQPCPTEVTTEPCTFHVEAPPASSTQAPDGGETDATTVWVNTDDGAAAREVGREAIADAGADAGMLNIVRSEPQATTRSATRRDGRVTLYVTGSDEVQTDWYTTARVFTEDGYMCVDAYFYNNNDVFDLITPNPDCGTADGSVNNPIIESYWVAETLGVPEAFACGSTLSNLWQTFPPNKLPGQPTVGVCG